MPELKLSRLSLVPGLASSQCLLYVDPARLLCVDPPRLLCVDPPRLLCLVLLCLLNLTILRVDMRAALIGMCSFSLLFFMHLVLHCTYIVHLMN